MGLAGCSAEFIPLMVEVLKDVKAIFKDNPVELFTKGTGGSEFSFYRQQGAGRGHLENRRGTAQPIPDQL